MLGLSGEFLIPVVMFLVIGACIIIPIWLRNNLRAKQLETLASAIEKGIDPERIAKSLKVENRVGDINGNWKAGVILVGIGIAIFVLGLPEAFRNGIDFDWLYTLMVPAFGIVLLIVHSTIVGPVVKHGGKPEPRE